MGVWVTHASIQPSRSALVLLLADLLAREAQFVVTIGNVRGVLDSSILDPEPGPDGPFISYSYYVTYDFVEDEDMERNVSGLVEATHHDSVLDEVCPSGPGNRMHPPHTSLPALVRTQSGFVGSKEDFIESYPSPCRELGSA